MIEFASENLLMDIVDVLVKYVKENVLPPIIEQQEEENHEDYYNWLEKGGFLYKDKKNNVKVKDDAPHYLEYDGAFEEVIGNVLYNIDVNYEEIMDIVEMDYDQDISYSVDDINDIISRRVQDAGHDEGWQWVYDDVARALANILGVQTDYYDSRKGTKLMGFKVYAYEKDGGYEYGGKDYR